MNPLQQLVQKLQYLTPAQLLLLLSQTDDMLLSNNLPMPDQWETTLTEFPSVKVPQTQFHQTVSTTDIFSSTLERGAQPVEDQTPPKPIRMPSKKELQQIYKQVEAGLPGQAAQDDSDSSSSSTKKQQKSDAADT